MALVLEILGYFEALFEVSFEVAVVGRTQESAHFRWQGYSQTCMIDFHNMMGCQM